jgi:surface protein
MTVFSKPLVVVAVGYLLFRAVDGKRCFKTKEELKEAVAHYLNGRLVKKLQTKFRYGRKIGDWCVNRVTDMSDMFYNKALFNEDISNWNVASVKNMRSMFSGTMYNGDLSKWNVSSVENMAYMFNDNTAFQGNLSNWNVAAVKDMSLLFERTMYKGDLSKWNVSSVDTMEGMFYNNTVFNQNLCAWSNKTGKLTNATDMFALTNCPFKSDPNLTAVPRGPF